MARLLWQAKVTFLKLMIVPLPVNADEKKPHVESRWA
jgi:hypothetical protein